MPKHRYLPLLSTAALALAGLIAITALTSTEVASRPGSSNQETAYLQWQQQVGDYALPDEAALRQMLSPLQYRVIREDGTEQAFNNPYWDNKAEGIYVDRVSGQPLFSSRDKYKSGSGWPSFTQPISNKAIVTHTDNRFFMTRVEVRSSMADSHLGHVFDDGPAPTGLRYCMNSAALRFIPRAELAAQGYGAFADLFD